jgi:hypothetical protein
MAQMGRRRRMRQMDTKERHSTVAGQGKAPGDWRSPRAGAKHECSNRSAGGPDCAAFGSSIAEPAGSGFPVVASCTNSTCYPRRGAWHCRILAAVAATCLLWSAVATASDETTMAGVTVTSMVRLLSNPQQYEGMRVQVVGYFWGGFEISGLFLTKESFTMGDTSSAIWVELPQNKTNRIVPIGKGYVRVQGTFHGNGRSGHLGLYPAAIEDVTIFETAGDVNAFSRPWVILVGLALAGGVWFGVRANIRRRQVRMSQPRPQR